MFRYLVALVGLIVLSDTASAACFRPFSRLRQRVVQRERHVTVQRGPLLPRVVLVPKKAAPCGAMGCPSPAIPAKK